MPDFPNILDTPPASGGGAYTLINSYSFSNQSEAAITGIPATYNSLRFIVDYMNTQGTIQRPLLQVSINGGVSYLNTNEYDWQVVGVDQGTAGTSGLKGQNATMINLTLTALIMASTGVGACMVLDFYNYTNAAANGVMFIQSSFQAAEDSTVQVIGGRGQHFTRISSAMNAFRIYTASANIDLEGRLYGMT